MPLVYQKNINANTRLGVWRIEETEAFFLKQVPIHREITHPNKRLQHLAGRYLLKEMYPDFPYDLIRIADTRKPFLENEAYHFSISHCGKYAAVMVSTHDRVGVDVELVTPKVNKVKHKFLSAFEQQLLQDNTDLAPHLSHDHLLTAAWSIKESLFKWQGSSEVDFIKHLHIQKIKLSEGQSTADCKLHKGTGVDLSVYFFFFENNCVSWVYSPPR